MDKTRVFEELKPKVVLGVAAHPDDLDFSSSATMAKFAADGAKVYYLLLTDGSKGSDDRSVTSEELVEIRHNEQRAALKAIGGQEVTFLDYPDAYLEVTMELKKQIAAEIRKRKPDVVVTMDPTLVYSIERGFINHSDHRAAGQATIDAVFPIARDHLTFPELYESGLEPHKVKTLLLTNFDNPTYFVDVSQTMDKKFAALREHASQIKDMGMVEDRFSAMAKKIGERAGYTYAEGFIRLDLPL